MVKLSNLNRQNFKRIIGEQFTDLLKGSALNIVAKILATGIGFFSSILLARFYGPETIGVLATITSIFTLGATIALLGLDTLILKLVPKISASHGSNEFGMYFKIVKLVALSGVTAGATLVLLAMFNQKIIPNVHIALPAVLIIVAAILRINSSMLRALGDYKLFSTLDILPAISMLLVVGAGGYFAIQKNIFIYLYYLSIILVCFVSFIFLKIYSKKMQRKNVKENAIKTSYKTPSNSNLLKTALPMLGVALSVVAIQHIDILLIGYYLEQSSVGIYAVYVRLASLVAFVTISVNSMFAPRVSLLFQADNKIELRKFVKFTTALLSIGSLSLAVLFIIFHKFILGLYGTTYSEDPTSLYILILSTLISSFFGSTGFFLNMTGGQIAFLRIMLFAALVNVLTNIFLIPLYGITGAAIANAVSVLIWNVLAMITIKRRHGYTLFYTGSSS